MSTLSTLYRGSVKDVRGPVSAGGIAAVIFDYSDAFSVFDWGRMPDSLEGKGAALATLGAWIFERLEDPATWKEFSRSKEAFALRRGNKFGGILNEIGEELQARGLRTHYLGVRTGDAGIGDVAALGNHPTREMVVKQVAVVRPQMAKILGQTVPDYRAVSDGSGLVSRLVPLEVVFRFSAPEGSSWRDRNPGQEPGPWEFPILESFTKLEPKDRLLSPSEALAISGLSAEEFSRLYFLSAWVGAYLKSLFGRAGLELADGKFEWALSEQRELFLVDAIGPDELRLEREGVALSKEFLRKYYRTTEWFTRMSEVRGGNRENNRESSHDAIDPDWKKKIAEGPPPLPTALREAATQLYAVLTNQVTGERWFKDAWELDKLVQVMKGMAHNEPRDDKRSGASS